VTVPRPLRPSQPGPRPPNQWRNRKPPAESKILPVIIRDASKWSSVSSAMTQRKITFSICVNPVTTDDFRALIHLLEESRLPFHSFTLPEENTPCRVPNGTRRDQPRRRQVRPGEPRPGTNQGDQDDFHQLQKTPPLDPGRGPKRPDKFSN
jgi:hypothetical protein